ncbi:MAG: hypothetical protein ACI865_003300 [Flavobacteriaceae bacterium]|jgi:hypothetical protein
MLKELGVFGFIGILFCGSYSFGQIEITNEPEAVETEIVASKPLPDGNTEVYMVANVSRTFSVLTESEGLSAAPLGEREFESFLRTWSFGIGYRTRVNEYLSIQGGITYFRNGESYLYETTDSLFSYTTTYAYIGMPIKALFTYGNDFKLLVGGGLIPQLFSGYRQDQEWKTTLNATGTETIKLKNGYSSFALSAAFNVGFQVKFSDKWALLVMPEYRIQLTDTYTDTDAYDHFGRAFGVDIGLTMTL